MRSDHSVETGTSVREGSVKALEVSPSSRRPKGRGRVWLVVLASVCALGAAACGSLNSGDDADTGPIDSGVDAATTVDAQAETSTGGKDATTAPIRRREIHRRRTARSPTQRRRTRRGSTRPPGTRPPGTRSAATPAPATAPPAMRPPPTARLSASTAATRPATPPTVTGPRTASMGARRIRTRRCPAPSRMRRSRHRQRRGRDPRPPGWVPVRCDEDRTRHVRLRPS